MFWKTNFKSLEKKATTKEKDLAVYEKLLSYYEVSEKKIIMPSYRNFNLVALTIADTHGWCAFNPDKVEKHFMDAPSYDVVLMPGDISAYDLEVISKYIEGVPTLYVAGNHDDPYIYLRRGYIDVSKRRVYVRNSYGEKIRIIGLDGSYCVINRAIIHVTHKANPCWLQMHCIQATYL